jgi:signal peptidase I
MASDAGGIVDDQFFVARDVAGIELDVPDVIDEDVLVIDDSFVVTGDVIVIDDDQILVASDVALVIDDVARLRNKAGSDALTAQSLDPCDLDSLSVVAARRMQFWRTSQQCPSTTPSPTWPLF